MRPDEAVRQQVQPQVDVVRVGRRGVQAPIVVRTAITSTPRAGSGPSRLAASGPSSPAASAADSLVLPLAAPAAVSRGAGYQVSSTVWPATVARPVPAAPAGWESISGSVTAHMLAAGAGPPVRQGPGPESLALSGPMRQVGWVMGTGLRPGADDLLGGLQVELGVASAACMSRDRAAAARDRCRIRDSVSSSWSAISTARHLAAKGIGESRARRSADRGSPASQPQPSRRVTQARNPDSRPVPRGGG